MRILCVSAFFPPVASAEAFCGGKLSLGLLAADADLTVLTVDYTSHPKFRLDPSDIWQPLSAVTEAIPAHGWRSKVASIPLGFRYGSIEWTRWIAGVVHRAYALHCVQAFDAVYSRALPNVAHVAAYWITQRLQLPWVANLNDPWDLEGAHLLPHLRHQRKRTLGSLISDAWLRRVMRSADILTFPCSRLRDYHLRLVPVPTRCVIIPHVGWSVRAMPQPNGFDLVHAGSLGSGESTRRNATTSLIQALHAFLQRQPEARRRFRLVLVGPEDRATAALSSAMGVSDNVCCTGRVSYIESLARIASASACLLVEGNMPEGIYLPSKLPDYLAARRPVIALSPARGTVADFEGQRGITRVDVDDSAAIQAVLAQHYGAFLAGELASLAPDDALAGAFDGAAIASELHTLFTDLRANGRHRRAHRRKAELLAGK